ncbi:MAG: cold shock domain-containing protein, partial [Chloroflexi bacterium]|nr:cold shock domain-containing protein [Chloroflexota bacterium]
EFHYETEIYPIDFRGRRIKADDRESIERPSLPERSSPKEKQVDVGLASSMLYYAAIPGAYEAAIAVIGDEDYVPALQLVRRLGKRVMIASVRGSCDEIYIDPIDPKRVRDVDTIFLNDLLDDIRLDYEPVVVECQSERHQGERTFSTRYRPRPGQRVYCPQCRLMYAEDRAATEAELNQAIDTNLLSRVLPGYKAGRVARLIAARGYGFIRSDDGSDFFFHASSLRDVEYQSLSERQFVQFVVNEEPSEHNQWRGNVREVRLLEAP